MFTFLVMAALAQQPPRVDETRPEVPQPANAQGGMAPEQVLATIDAKGNLTLVHVSCNCFGPPAQETMVEVPGKKDEKPTKVKVKVSSVTMTTAELPAKHVEAYTASGERIEPDKLAKLLAKERTVLVSMDGKKVDPFHLQLYKDDTIVLVPPANTLNIGVGGYYGQSFGPGGPPEVIPVPLPPKANPEETIRKIREQEVRMQELKERQQKEKAVREQLEKLEREKQQPRPR